MISFSDFLKMCLFNTGFIICCFSCYVALKTLVLITMKGRARQAVSQLFFITLLNHYLCRLWIHSLKTCLLCIIWDLGVTQKPQTLLALPQGTATTYIAWLKPSTRSPQLCLQFTKGALKTVWRNFWRYV